MRRKIPFNIHDLNYILTFAGFAIFTSMSQSISSVVYRAFALFVALLCLFVQRFRLPKIPSSLKVLLVIMVLLDIKTTIHLFIEPTVYLGSRATLLLFMYGITLIPILAFISGSQQIHWKSMLVVLELLLFFTILSGYISTLDIVEEERMSLNNRQSTLAFGDNSGYLLLLSICLLRYSSMMVSKKTLLWIWRVFLLIAIVISAFGLARAGSRGPFVASVIGLLFVLVTLRVRKQINTFILAGLFVAIFGITTETLERFAPVLFSRMTMTIDERDSSGRDVLFTKAIHLIEENPILGDNPIILQSDGFTSYHNGYLVVGVGLGVVGLLIYIGLSLWILFRFFARRHLLTTVEFLFIGGMFFYSALRATTGANIIYNPNYTLMMVCACLVLSKLSRLQ